MHKRYLSSEEPLHNINHRCENIIQKTKNYMRKPVRDNNSFNKIRTFFYPDANVKQCTIVFDLTTVKYMY